MNGVRRLLNAAAAGASNLSAEQYPDSPPALNSPLMSSPSDLKPNWPPNSASPSSPIGSKANTAMPGSTAALFLKDRNNHARNVSSTSSASGSGSHRPTRSVSSSSSTTRKSPSRVPPLPLRKDSSTFDPKRNSINDLNTKDKLLMSLLASEAALDSRNFEILGSDEVEELKKEQELLTSRLQASQKKLALETKIRDAATSLSRVNSTSGKKVAKQSGEQLETANKRLDATQREYWRVSERTNEVQRKLLEHRAAVLSLSVRNTDKKPVNGTHSNDSGYSTPSNGFGGRDPLSPTTSNISSGSGSARISRFDGAHFFAGHVDAVVPSSAATATFEVKLKNATEALAEATKKQGNMAKELSMLKLEKEQTATTTEMERQSAKDIIDELEREMPKFAEMEVQLKRLQQEKDSWRRERMDLESRQPGAEVMSEKNIEIEELRQALEQERRQWDAERADMEDSKMEDLARLQEEMERLRDEDGVALRNLKGVVEGTQSSMQALLRTHGIPSTSPNVDGLVRNIGNHLGTLQTKLSVAEAERHDWETLKRKLDEDVRTGWDKREALLRDVEEARREREDARREVRALEMKIKECSSSPELSRSTPSPNSTLLSSLDGSSSGGELPGSKVIQMLQPLWTILPSPEGRAAKGIKQFHPGSFPPPSSPSPSSDRPVKSLSEMDVRSLKALYDATSTNGRSHAPPSPINAQPFNMDGFVARVQALIADDKALIERLVRFAQAHDLLKRNAERAQKLAQESQMALETYQKQVKTLEERNMALGNKQANFQDELAALQDTVDRIAVEKQAVESQAAEQAETMRQLTEANNTLSAKTLSLAAEAADTTNLERLKKTLGAQLAETNAKLVTAEQEIDEMRSNEQMQRIQLLDELNTLQTDNGQLRAQIRALKK